MKFTRILLITAGVLLALGAVVVGLACNASFQRWAVLRAARDYPGLKLAVAEVSAGLGAVTVRGAQLELHGVAVSVALLEADYSLWSVVVHRRLQIGRLTASGVLIDASRISRTQVGVGAAGAPAATPGVLSRVRLPIELVLGDCEIQGRALLPGAPGKPPVPTDYRITGGRFAPGEEGALLIDAQLADPAPAARVSLLRVQLRLRVAETAERSFSRIGVSAVVKAEGPHLSGDNQLMFAAQLSRDATGETYTVNLDTLSHGIAEHLLDVRAALPAGKNAYAGEWSLKARSAQVEPFFLGGALPEFDADGTGRFSFQPATASATLQGHLNIVADELGAIRPALRALGLVKIQADFDVAREGPVTRLNRLDLTVTGAQPVLELHAKGASEINFRERRLVVGRASTGEIIRLKLLGLPVAWVRPFVTDFDVSGGSVTGELAFTAEGGTLRAQTVEPLRIDRVSVMQAGRLLLDRAALALRAGAEISAVQLQIEVPELTLQTAAGDRIFAQAKISVPAGRSPPVSIAANYSADLPTLLAPLGPLGPLGPMRTKGAADLTLQGARLTVRQWTAEAVDAQGAKIFSVAALREFQFDLATRQTVGGAGATDLVRFTVGRLPLGRFLPLIAGGNIEGTVEPGDFFLSADGAKLAVRTASPLRLSGVSFARGGRTAVTRLAIEASPVVEVTGRSGLHVQSGDVTVRNADGATLLTAKADVSTTEKNDSTANLNFQLEVPALATQPPFAGAAAVSQGHASGEIRAAIQGHAAQVEARMTLNGLVLRDGNRPLPVANLSLRAVALPDGKITVQMPLLVDRAGQRSDLNFSADLARAAGKFEGEVKLSGERVDLDDALVLLGVFFAPLAAAEAAPATSTGTAVRPAWANFNGHLALEVKSLTKGKDWAMTGLTGVVNVEPAQATLQKLEAAFGEKSRLQAKAKLEFAGGPQPYQLTGDFSLTEFDAGKLFKAIEPGRPPTVEGLFTVAGHLAGTGANLAQTVERTRGQFDLTSRQGIFRGLKRSTDKVSVATKAVELGASVLGSLFGQEKVTKAAEKIAGQAYFIDQLAASLGELPYDQFSLRLTRDESLDVILENVSLVAPDIHLTGHGKVSHTETKPLLEQPLSVELAMGGRGKIEQNLGKIGLLDGTRDDLDYAKMKAPVTVGGTLARPDPGPFFSRLAKSKLGDLLVPDGS